MKVTESGIGVTSIFFGAVSGIKLAIREVIALNTAQTELNKVLDIGTEELDNYTKKAFQMGEALGRTGKDVLLATAEFARAGYNLQESNQLAEQALLLTNIADGLENTAEAAGYLIAVIKGYGLEVGKAEHITSLLNEVSNNYAVNAVKLAEGLQRTSGTLSQTGTSMEELSGILTGGYEVLRNMEKVSSGLITISQRLRGVSESGEEIDGLMPKLQESFKEFAGIDIQTTNGQLRSTYDILSDLAKVWHTLNDEQRQIIGEQASGIRQAPVLNAILMNWKNVEGASKTALNSMGSAIKENEKYMASLQGKINQLNSALSKLAYDTISSGVVGSIIDFTTQIVKAANAFGGFNSATLLITGSLLMLSEGFQTFSTSIATQFIASLYGVSSASANASVIIGGTTISVKALASAMTLGLAIAIPFVIKLLSSLYKSLDEQRQKVEELKSRYNELKTNIENLNNTNNRTPDQDKYLELLERELWLQEQIFKAEHKRLIQLELFGDKWFGGTFGIGDKGLVKEVNEFVSALEHNETTIQSFMKDIEELQNQGHSADALIQRVEKLKNQNIQLEANLISAKKKLDEWVGSLGSDAPEAVVDLLDKVNDLLPKLEQMNGDIEDTANATNNSTPALSSYAQELKNANDQIDSYDDSLSKLISSYKTLSEGEQLSEKTLGELIKLYPSVAEYISQTGDLTLRQGNLLKDLAEKDKETTLIALKNSRDRAQAALNEAKAKAYLTQVNMFGFAFDDLGAVGLDQSLEMYGQYKKAFEEEMKAFNAIDALIKGVESRSVDSIMDKSTKSSSSSKRDPKTLSDYFFQLEKIARLEAELSAHQSSESIYGETPESTETRIELIKQLQSELHNLNDARREELQSLQTLLPTLDVNSDKYVETQEHISKLTKDIESSSQSWFNYEQQLKSISDTAEKTAYDLQKAILQGQKQNIELEFEIKQNKLKEDLAELQRKLDDEVLEIEIKIKDKENAIRAIEESERVRKEHEERTKQITEINKLETKLFYMKQIQSGNLTDEMAKQVGLEKEKAEYEQRQLKLQELQYKLEKLRNQKNIQQLAKKDDGTFDFEYVADQEAIDQTMNEIQTAQTDFNNWQKDNVDNLYDDLISKKQSYDEWERQNTLQRHLDMLRLQVQNDQERIRKLKEGFETEKRERETKLLAEKEQALLHFRDIETLTTEHLILLKVDYENNWNAIQSHLEGKFNKIKQDYLAMLAVLSTPIATGAGGVNMKTVAAPKTVMSSIQTKHEGGIVGDGSRDLPEMVNKLFNAKPNEQLVLALKGELFIPQDNIHKNFVPNIKNLMNSINAPIVSTRASGDTHQHFNISKLEFPNVHDGQEVVDTLKHLSIYVEQKIKK